MAQPIINGNSIEFAIVEQVSPTSGVPATPAFYVMPRTDGDITDNPNYTKSNRVDTTRQGSESILTSLPIDGSWNDEFAVADPVLHMILEGTLQNKFSTAVNYTASTISFDTGGTIDDTADLAFADVVVGQFIGVTGATDASLNRVYRVTAKTDAGTVTVAPAPAVTEAVGASVTIKASMLRSGNSEIGYTIQKRTPTTTGTQYETFENFQFGSFGTSQTESSLFTTSYAGMATDKLDGTAIIAGQTDVAVDYERILSPVNGIPYIWMDNVPQTTKDLMATEVTIGVDNGTTGLGVLNSVGYGAIGHNLITVTGNFNTYADKANPLVEKLKSTNSTLFSLALEYRDVNGNTMVITRDSVIYAGLTQTETSNGAYLMNSGTTDADGKNNDYKTTIQVDYIPA